MRVCIHRGTREIGGTCAEIEAQSQRLVLEVGLPLNTPETETLLPPVLGFREIDETLMGVVISHSHQDIYSLWEGYLKEEPTARFLNWLYSHDISMTQIHTSGHAAISDLQRLAKAINPKTVVPIHSFEPLHYREFFTNVEIKQDGIWWDVK